jgi:hypothetical protein
MNTARPVIALLAARQPDRFLQLAAAVRRWCEVPALGQDELGPPDAVIATSPWVELPDGLPVAVWVDHEDELSSPSVAERAEAVLATRTELLDGVGRRGMLIPTGDPVPGAAYVSPFVRQRLRRARGLPPHPVLGQVGVIWSWPGRGAPLSDFLVPTALACAAAACVESAGALVAAMAFGTPTVTDEATAGAVGAVPGQQVLIADTAVDRRLLAESVARDPATASRLSWAGRQHYERRYDMLRTATVLVARLLLPGHGPGGALAGVHLRLGELNTPPTATIWSRLEAGVASLPGPAPNGE